MDTTYKPGHDTIYGPNPGAYPTPAPEDEVTPMTPDRW